MSWLSITGIIAVFVLAIAAVFYRHRQYIKDLMASISDILGDSDPAFPKQIPDDMVPIDQLTRTRPWPPAPWDLDPKVTLATAGMYPFFRMEEARSNLRLAELTKLWELEKSKPEPDMQMVEHLQQLRIHESNLGASFLLAYLHSERHNAVQPQGQVAHVE